MDHLLDLVDVRLMNSVFALQFLPMPLEELLHILERMVWVDMRCTLHAAHFRQLPAIILMLEVSHLDYWFLRNHRFLIWHPELLLILECLEVRLLRVLRRSVIAILLVGLLGGVVA
jgi:hypothetical protein